jgi:putative glutamine amidotransferase
VAVVVGVTSYTPAVTERRSYALPCEYIDSVRASGADVVVLPNGAPAALLDRLDGLVLAGGGDIDPSRYEAQPHTTTYMVDPLRDEFEIGLVRHALELDMPLLAICRGMQILNIALGGTLVPHVPERWGDAVVHRAPPREPTRHAVEIEPESRLHGILGENGPFEVVSWHHQALDRLGTGLRVVARAADGLPEAVETAGPDWTFGVQWHPELSAHRDPRQANLFREHARAADLYCRRKR